MTAKTIEKELSKIKDRNKRVEADKAWEISWTRKIFIAVLTYIVFVVFFIVAGLPSPCVNALVPSFAFLISTLTLNLIKKLWLKHHMK
jgi:hypothetical protein